MANKAFIFIATAGILVFSGFMIFKNSSVVTPPAPSSGEVKNTETPPAPVVLSGRDQLLADLKAASEKEDYAAFAKLLKKVYEEKWDREKDFQTVESELYVKADKKYFTAGDYKKSLEVSTIVYQAVPQGWRFAYLRIITLQKMGLDAFAAGDLKTAEEKAKTILQMSFRLEGTNLMADVYIKKIETNILAKDKKGAEANLAYIWDFEVSKEKRDRLIALKSEVAKL